MVDAVQNVQQPAAWITLHQAAEHLNVCYHTIWRAVVSGQLWAKRCGPRNWRTTRAACDRFMGLADPTAEVEAPIEIPPEQVALLENLQRRGISTNGGHQGWQQQNKKSKRARRPA